MTRLVERGRACGGRAGGDSVPAALALRVLACLVAALAAHEYLEIVHPDGPSAMAPCCCSWSRLLVDVRSGAAVVLSLLLAWPCLAGR